MRVRPAIATDLPALLLMASEFYAASGYDREGPFDPEFAIERIDMVRQGGILLVAVHDDDVPVGMVGLVVGPGLCARSTKAFETCWWVRPAHRRTKAGDLLFDAAEAAARDAGCIGIQMVSLEGRSAPAVARYYRRRGYDKTESSWTKLFPREN